MNIDTLTDDELRIEVAKIVGWRWDDHSVYSPGGGTWARHVDGYTDSIDMLLNVLPDFPRSIDASWTLWQTAKAEGGLMWSQFVHLLVNPNNATDWNVRDALAGISPRTICVAFLRAKGAGE